MNDCQRWLLWMLCIAFVIPAPAAVLFCLGMAASGGNPVIAAVFPGCVLAVAAFAFGVNGILYLIDSKGA